MALSKHLSVQSLEQALELARYGEYVHVCFNTIVCPCGVKCSSHRRHFNHLVTSQCWKYSGEKHQQSMFTCMCGYRFHYEEMESQIKPHVARCKYMNDMKCSLCECTTTWNEYSKVSNHIISVHLKSKRVDFRNEMISFCQQPQLEAQVGFTRYAHMQLDQLRDKARNNKSMRLILRCLILESDFQASNSKFLQLCVRGKAPIFHRTGGKLVRVKMQCQSEIVEVILDPREDFSRLIYDRIKPFIILEAHSLADYFSVNHRHVHSLDDVTLNLMERVTAFLDSLSINVDVSAKIANFLFTSYECYKFRDDPTFLFFLIARFLVNNNVPFDIITRTKNYVFEHIKKVAEWLSPTPYLSAHVGEDVVASIVTIIGTLGSVLLMRDLPSLPKLAELVGGVKKMGDFSRAVTNSWTMIEKIISATVSHLYEWFTGYPSHIAELKTCLIDVDKWYLEIQEITSLSLLEEIDNSSALCKRIEDLYLKGLKFAQQIQHYKLDAKLVSAFYTHMRVVTAYYDKANASGAFRSGPRVEPLTIMMHGDSGVGKSTVVYALAIHLLQVEGISGDWTSDIYVRNIEDEFYDGYTNQRAVIVDDFGQLKDSQSNPNLEFMELIRVGNSAPWHLHMAELSEKKNTFFTSKIYLMTSNLERFKPESLSCADAVKRRFEVCARVLNKSNVSFLDPVSRKRRLDTAKVAKEYGPGINLDVYEFQLTDGDGNDLQVPPMSYWSFMELCRDKYRERHMKSGMQHKFLQELVDTPYISVPSDEVFQAHVLTDPQLVKIADRKTRVCGLTLSELREVMNSWPKSTIQEFCEYGFLMHQMLYSDEFKRKMYLLLAEYDGHAFNSITDEYAEKFVMIVDESTTILTENWEEVFQDYVRAEIVKKDPYPLHQRLFFVHFVAHSIRNDEEVMRKCAVKQQLSMLKAQSAKANKDFAEFVHDSIEMAKTHSTLLMYLTLIPAICGFAWTIFRYLRSDNDKIYDHDHCGLKLGEKVKHKHKCEKCLNVYEHEHTIKINNRNRYKNWCMACQRDSAVLNYTRYPEMNLEEDLLDQQLRNKGVYQDTIVDCETCFMSHEKDGRCYFHPSDYLANFVGFDADTGKLEGELSASGDPQTQRAQKLRVEMKKKRVAELSASADPVTKKPSLKTELAIDPNAMSLAKKVSNNMYDIVCEIDGVFLIRVKIVIIHGRIGLTVAHLMPYLKKSTRIKLVSHNVPDGFIFNSDRLQYQIVSGAVEEKDQLLIAFPSGFVDHPSLLKNIVDSQGMSTFKKVRGVLISPSETGTIMRYGDINSRDREERIYLDEVAKKSFNIRERYEYSLETSKGDCGSVLLAVNSKLMFKILGIHVCGSIGLGIASPLNISQIETAIQRFPKQAQVGLDIDIFIKDFCDTIEMDLPEGNFVPCGKSTIEVQGAKKTRIVPSEIHGEIGPVKTKPAQLVPFVLNGKYFDPMKIGLAKAGPMTPEVNQTFLDVAINDMKTTLNCDVKMKNQRVLSDIEAVTGVEGDPFLGPIKRQTSAGFPWVKERTGVGKTKWLGHDEVYTLSPEVQKAMNDRIDFAVANRRYPTIWIDTLKDERRPIEKVDQGKTRVFSAGPMDFTLVFRKYFLGFAAHCSEGRNWNEISVGTNVFSQDWSDIALRMRTHGKHVIAGDFTNFDGTLVGTILESIIEIIHDFYQDDEMGEQIRNVLWREIVNSIHLRENDIYLWTHSQPSGCPITAILNSIYNSVSMRYVWMVLTEGTSYHSMKSFHEHVSMVSYGDDNLINVSDEILPLFNQNTIAAGYATIGMVYTDESKSHEMLPARVLEDVSYLKRKFVYSDAEKRWLAPLSLDTVIEMCNWVRGENDSEERTVENIETSAFELSLHPEEIFMKWTDLYRKVTRNFTHRPRILTYYEYRTCEMNKYGYLCALS
jgi:DNA replication protein DnaC